jgi:uncharacterized protein (TIGR03083 family)
MFDAATTTPVLTAHLFRPLAGELLDLLNILDDDAWERPTSAGTWRVRDVVAHLVDGDLRRLSAMRDRHLLQPDRAIDHSDDIVHWLDELNADWVRAAGRLSTRVLTELLTSAAPRVAEIMEAADPHAAATFPVTWTGATTSPMWLDIGREFTERWHHQDQIREAVGAPPLASPGWLRPVIELSLLALPRAWRVITPEEGTTVALRVNGQSGGTWTLVYATSWRLARGDTPNASCSIQVDDLSLARLLLHRLSGDAAHHILHVEGDAALAAPLLTARAVMVRAI